MIETNKRSLESSLLGIQGVSKVKVEGMSLKEFVQNTVQESLAQIKKTKLTWGRGQIPPPVNPKFIRGMLRMDRPWIGPLGRGKYFIQNALVLFGNGEKVKDLSTISRAPVKEMVQQRGGGFIEMTFPSDWDLVENAMKIYVMAALKLDPNLCPYCVRFSSEDRKAMTKHVFEKHPKEFTAEMESVTSTEDPAEAVAEPDVA